jgi:hypothetical protein
MCLRNALESCPVFAVDRRREVRVAIVDLAIAADAAVAAAVAIAVPAAPGGWGEPARLSC